MIKRYHIFVSGQVQGVGFRGFCMMHAQQLGLTGSVTNLDNGMVEIYVQGETEKIDEFLGRIVKGDRFIHVTDYSIKEVPVVKNEKRFVYGWGNTYW